MRAANWLNKQVQAEIGLFREALTIRLPNKALLARLWQLHDDGGLLLSHDLAETVPGIPRAARLMLQLDGDTMLFVPKDFAEHPEDAARLTGLHAAAADELAQFQAALPYNWASLVAVVLRTGFTGTTLFNLPDAAGSVIALIGKAPETVLASLPWWSIAGAVSGPLGLVFGPTLRRGITRGAGWLLRRGMRPRT